MKFENFVLGMGGDTRDPIVQGAKKSLFMVFC